MDTPASPMPSVQPAPVPQVQNTIPVQPVQQPPPAAAPPAPKKKIVLPKWFLWVAIACFVAILAAVGIYVFVRVSSPDEISIRNQSVIEGNIRVERVYITSPKGGFLVIYRLLNENFVVAMSFYLFPETYTDFTFPISPDVDPKNLAGNLFMGVLYEDTNASNHWEPEFDHVIKTIFGKQVKSLFRDTNVPEPAQ